MRSEGKQKGNDWWMLIDIEFEGLKFLILYKDNYNG